MTIIVHGETDIIFNNKAWESRQNFEDYVEAPITPAGGIGPRFGYWKTYLEGIAMVANTSKYLGPIPTNAQMEKFINTVNLLLDQLETKEFREHYEELIEELIMSGETTRSLIEKRKENPKKKKVTDDIKLKICDSLRRFWWHHTKQTITGSFDNKNPDIPGNQDEQNVLSNPGAYFVQKVFDIYLGVKLDNRQIRSLIEATEKKYNRAEYKFPLTWELVKVD